MPKIECERKGENTGFSRVLTGSGKQQDPIGLKKDIIEFLVKSKLASSEDCVARMSKSQLAFSLLLSLFLVRFAIGCVSQTERVGNRPYGPPPYDESVWDEIKREFGWEQSSSEEPFYKGTARGIKETVSRWFEEEEDLSGKGYNRDATRRQYEIRRQHAIRRVRQQDTLQGRITIQQ